MDYNQTVHLPQTDFPMRAGLPKREPEMLREFDRKDLYRKLMRKTRASPSSCSTTARPTPTATSTSAPP